MKRGRKKVEEDAGVKVEEESEAGKESKRSPKLQRKQSADDISAGVPIEEAPAAGPSEDVKVKVESEAGPSNAAKTKQEEEDEEDEILSHHHKSSSKVVQGAQCPYLDTISRQNLDFDFEKCCSVSLSPVNVYACLVCGKYFSGRGPGTHAYTHSLELNHHMFMKLDSGKVYCLPDMYEVVDRSLDVIRFVLNPRFGRDEIAAMDTRLTWERALDGSEYMPGLVGLNNMKANDYANVAIQIMARVRPVRDFFLVPENYAGVRSQLVQRFGELLRKVWNPRAFKGQVSPHEFMQAVMKESGKTFIIDKQGDPLKFINWLVDSLHAGLTDGHRKRKSVISQCFQGELEVITQKGTGKAAGADDDVVDRVPFFLLALDLPPAPLYKDALNDKNIIPQVPIFDLLRKYNGEQMQDHIKFGRRRFRLTRLPTHLVLTVERFTKNNYFIEKNPTIVNFPVKNLELSNCVPVPKGKDGAPVASKYDLIANVCHQGETGKGTYLVHIHRKVEDIWFEVQDLRVTDILPQMVALSETYIQVYELKDTDKKPLPALK